MRSSSREAQKPKKTVMSTPMSRGVHGLRICSSFSRSMSFLTTRRSVYRSGKFVAIAESTDNSAYSADARSSVSTGAGRQDWTT